MWASPGRTALGRTPTPPTRPLPTPHTPPQTRPPRARSCGHRQAPHHRVERRPIRRFLPLILPRPRRSHLPLTRHAQRLSPVRVLLTQDGMREARDVIGLTWRTRRDERIMVMDINSSAQTLFPNPLIKKNEGSVDESGQLRSTSKCVHFPEHFVGEPLISNIIPQSPTV